MKKFISLLLVVTMALSLVACGGKETPDNVTPTPGESVGNDLSQYDYYVDESTGIPYLTANYYESLAWAEVNGQLIYGNLIKSVDGDKYTIYEKSSGGMVFTANVNELETTYVVKYEQGVTQVTPVEPEQSGKDKLLALQQIYEKWQADAPKDYLLKEAVVNGEDISLVNTEKFIGLNEDVTWYNFGGIIMCDDVELIPYENDKDVWGIGYISDTNLSALDAIGKNPINTFALLDTYKLVYALGSALANSDINLDDYPEGSTLEVNEVVKEDGYTYIEKIVTEPDGATTKMTTRKLAEWEEASSAMMNNFFLDFFDNAYSQPTVKDTGRFIYDVTGEARELKAVVVTEDLTDINGIVNEIPIMYYVDYADGKLIFNCVNDKEFALIEDAYISTPYELKDNDARKELCFTIFKAMEEGKVIGEIPESAILTDKEMQVFDLWFQIYKETWLDDYEAFAIGESTRLPKTMDINTFHQLMQLSLIEKDTTSVVQDTAFIEPEMINQRLDRMLDKMWLSSQEEMGTAINELLKKLEEEEQNGNAEPELTPVVIVPKTYYDLHPEIYHYYAEPEYTISRWIYTIDETSGFIGSIIYPDGTVIIGDGEVNIDLNDFGLNGGDVRDKPNKPTGSVSTNGNNSYQSDSGVPMYNDVNPKGEEFVMTTPNGEQIALDTNVLPGATIKKSESTAFVTVIDYDDSDVVIETVTSTQYLDYVRNKSLSDGQGYVYVDGGRSMATSAGSFVIYNIDNHNNTYTYLASFTPANLTNTVIVCYSRDRRGDLDLLDILKRVVLSNK